MPCNADSNSEKRHVLHLETNAQESSTKDHPIVAKKAETVHSGRAVQALVFVS